MAFFEARKAGGSAPSGFNYQTWLASASISVYGYADLAAVLADEVAVRKLMTIHASVDYLASFTSTVQQDILTILNNDICAKWINLRDYALDKLDAAYHSVMVSAGKYFYGEWALMPQVPKMTSNTAPYGEVFYNGTLYYSNYAWYVFDGDGKDTLGNPSSYATTTKTNSYIGYHFTSPIRINGMALQGHFNSSGRCPKNFKVQASNDNSTWTDLYTGIKVRDTAVENFSFENDTAYQYYRLFVIDIWDPSNEPIMAITTIQFNAWAPKGNVPIMTSNTAPYGTASADYESSTYLAYKAFDGDPSTFWNTWSTSSTPPHYLTYKFTNPVNVKRIYVRSRTTDTNIYIKDFKIQASNDGSTYIDLYQGTYDSSNLYTGEYHDIPNSNYYLYYRLYVINTYNNQPISISMLQFYGREMKVSVPVMTSNTAPYGVASASSENTDTFNASKAFNGVASTQSTNSWLAIASDTAAWICYKFPSPVCVRALDLVINSYNYTSATLSFDIEGSNNGTDWETLETSSISGISTTATWAQSKKTLTLDNDAAYQYYRVNFGVALYISGTSFVAVNKLQFYGFDYSEYDWDTDTPRHYLYDHGVEIEELQVLSFANGWGTAQQGTFSWNQNSEKRPSELYIAGTSQTSGIGTRDGFGTNSAVDVSVYNLMRYKCANTGTNSIGVHFGISPSEKENCNSEIASKWSVGPEDYINISSINQSSNILIWSINDAQRKGFVYEAWLE